MLKTLRNDDNSFNISRFKSLKQMSHSSFMTPTEMEIVGHLCNIRPDNITKQERRAIGHLKFAIVLKVNAVPASLEDYNFLVKLHYFLDAKFGEIYTCLPIDIMELRRISWDYLNSLVYRPYLGIQETLKLRSKIMATFREFNIELEGVL